MNNLYNLFQKNYTFDDNGNLIIKLTEKDINELKMKKISNNTPKKENSNNLQNKEPEKQRKKYHRTNPCTTYVKTNVRGVYYNTRMGQYTARISTRIYKDSKSFAVLKHGNKEAQAMATAARAEFVKTYKELRKGIK